MTSQPNSFFPGLSSLNADRNMAMSVNDMLVQGAEPLFFLDYLAVNNLKPAIIAEMVKGIAAGCRMADCALIGGETAEMPDVYRKDDFDMAGFAVGLVERDRIIDGSGVVGGFCVVRRRSTGSGERRRAG